MSGVMGDPKTVLEGSVKYRDKKKWKSRWAVVSKLSPVADCLHIQLYRDSKERCKNGPTKASLSLEEFLGLETGFTLDKESNTMALVCAEVVVVLAFDNRELLIQWQVKIRANLVEEQQFLVQIAHVPAKSKLPCGPARLHLQDHTFCLVSGVPPRLLGTWPIKELRRFGVVEGKFCFEGGSLCGKGEGLHVLLTNQCEELSQSMDLASKGKLQGKRKTLNRKNSVLESSSRMPLHKRCHMDSSRSTTGDSSRNLISSGSECSTCDACSTDHCGDDIVYSSSASSMKASSCRIHYRWPSCLSRWGQSSTTTASDVDSVDTVSVILSDFQGSPHSGTLSKSNGQSLSCLCDTQGTWPFNQCTKCGRQFYGRGSLQSCKGKPASPEHLNREEVNGFSPQWTMDSLVGSTDSGQQTKKDSTYQLMNPPSDRASLCSHASHSSSASAASSSGSEYSVPKNFMDNLYDKPKNIQHALNVHENGKTIVSRTNGVPLEHTLATNKENCVLCPCHEPIGDWMSASMTSSSDKPIHGHTECGCWKKLSMSVRSDQDIRVMNGRKSASANPSPNSSPKKSRYNTGASTMRSMANNTMDCDLTCTCGKGDPSANYSVPRSAIMHPKDVPLATATLNKREAKVHVPSEDYDVPKKFTELLSNCDMMQKNAAFKSLINGTSCSCINTCKMVPNIELLKLASKHSHNTKHGSLNSSAIDALHMCACQRVMLWAGSLVPCLGPQSSIADTGWQCTKSHTADGCRRPWYNHANAVCSEPHRTAEVVMMNGKPKHIIREASADLSYDLSKGPSIKHSMRPRASTISYSTTGNRLETSPSTVSCNYANIDFSSDAEGMQVKVTDDSSTVNYANLDFADILYENSNLVLSRLAGEEIVPSKPPLPPRSHVNTAKKLPESMDNESKDKCLCKQVPVNRSPKKVPKQVNGSAYEMMCYDKNPPCDRSDEDYLMMQPLCMKQDELSPSKQSLSNDELSVAPTLPTDSDADGDPQKLLPLRPFMPFSYPIAESPSANIPEGVSCDSMLRMNQLKNEDLQLRAMRSNSLSELKKKVLMRKRSCSVDGKSNGYLSKDSGTESIPASPVSSPSPSVRRKNSLLSKFNLRTKEKSMSTNEIDIPLPPDNGPCDLSISHKNGHHRSADCLKMGEDFANSDEDLNSDNSDFILQKNCVSSPMKRSSSVPCRAAMPTLSISSPIRTNGTIMELNDLNKEGSENTPDGVEESQEPVQRKYSLDSHERSKQRITVRDSNCDNVYRQDCLDESDTVMEMQGILRRNHVPPSERGHNDSYRSNTSSCSSSDISDYMESLSFISRSSSSSSGSTGSADYMRSEEIYRTLQRPPARVPVVGSSNIAIPGVHQSRITSDNNGLDTTGRTLKHRSLNDACDSSSVSTTSSSSLLDSAYYRGKDDLAAKHCTSIRCNRDSRSSTSSTSSLSTSPSVTDYSSSTSSSPSCQNLPPKQALSKRKPPDIPSDKPIAQQILVPHSGPDKDSNPAS